MASEPSLQLQGIPVIDNHCHPPLRREVQTEDDLKRYFTESLDPRIVSGHVQHTLFYQQGLRDMASALDCPPDAGSIIARRAELGMRDYLRLIVTRARIRGLAMDTGYQASESYSLDEVRGMLEGTECTVWHVLRLETLIERLTLEHRDFGAFMAAYISELHALTANGVAAVKSIVAYRTGLDIAPTDEARAGEAFDTVIGNLGDDGSSLRIDSKPLLDFLVPLAMEEAARQMLPFQFHTALGDTDVDLRQANPLDLRPVLEAQSFRELPIVLLHCYPYVREAAYLSAMYGNVYFDLSMTIPLLTFTSTRALEDALGIAPASKLLYGSDAPSMVDYLWLGAVSWRRALESLLSGWVAQGMPESEATRIARLILHDNAEKLYARKADAVP